MEFKEKKVENNLNLSFGCPIGNASGRILEIRDFLARGLNCTEDILPNSVHCVPKKNIHFSSIEFMKKTTFSEKIAKETVEQYGLSHKTEIKKFKKRILDEIIKIGDSTRVVIDEIYTADELYAISLKTRPSKEIITFAQKCIEGLDFGEKGFPKVKIFVDEKGYYFATNIIRFFRDLNGGESRIMTSRIDKINSELEKNPIIIDSPVKNFELIISDDYHIRTRTL